MRVISANVNGIRSAANKGFFGWLDNQNADVICLQEVRASESQLTDKVYHPDGYHAYFSVVEKKGYSGVAVYTKQKPDNITHGLGWDIANTEGRYLEVDFGDLCIASVYLPSGTSGEERQAVKFDFLNQYLPVLQAQIANGKEYILCGDWNIAHKNLDVKNWRGNQKTSGFLPEERAWIDRLFTEVGFVDSYRHLYPDKEQYTWWSTRSKTAWENNIGWRIDYQIITPGLKDKILACEVYKGEKFSDHAPVIVDYNLNL
jgi:exodeoxyribonuclease-3